MSLKKVIIPTPQGNQFGYEPLNHLALFKHCSEGSIAVTKTYWISEVWPVLKAHGITDYTVIGEVKKFK